MLNQWMSWESIKKYILQSNLVAERSRLAVTGWADGTLSSVNRPNFIKVRFDDDKSEAEVYNESVPLAYGIQVLVYKGTDNILRAKHPSRSYQIKDFLFSFVKNHAVNHGPYGVDALYVQNRAFLPLHPRVSSTWEVSVRPGWIVFNDQTYWFAGQTVNVQAYRPGGGTRFVLLSAGLQTIGGVKTVKIIVTPGVDKGSPVAPDDFPKIPIGTAPICAVRVSIYQRKLNDREVDGDIYDLRLSGGGPSGFSEPLNISSPTVHTSTATPGKLLKADVNGLPASSAYSDEHITSVFTRLTYHTEPIAFNGELLFLNGDIVVMEVQQ